MLVSGVHPQPQPQHQSPYNSSRSRQTDVPNIKYLPSSPSTIPNPQLNTNQSFPPHTLLQSTQPPVRQSSKMLVPNSNAIVLPVNNGPKGILRRKIEKPPVVVPI